MLERCPYQRGVCLREVSVLESCPSYRSVYLMERCLSQRSVRLREVSVSEPCLSQIGVCLRDVSVVEHCLSQRGVHLREVSVLESCPSQNCPSLNSVRYSDTNRNIKSLVHCQYEQYSLARRALALRQREAGQSRVQQLGAPCITIKMAHQLKLIIIPSLEISPPPVFPVRVT